MINICSLKYEIPLPQKENEIDEITWEVSSGLPAILDWVTKPRNDGNIHQVADRLEDVASIMHLHVHCTTALFVSILTIALAVATQAMGKRGTCVTLVADNIRHVDAYRYKKECNAALEQLVSYYDLL